MQLIWHLKAPDTILSVQDTHQTPPRHLPDTLQTPQVWHIFYQPKATRSQETSSSRLVHWVFINCLHIIPPRQYPESLIQPPDTSQTLSRQPSDIPGEKKPADQNYFNWIYVNQYHIIPSTNIDRFGVVCNMSDGVEKVSGGCLDDSGYCLDG